MCATYMAQRIKIKCATLHIYIQCTEQKVTLYQKLCTNNSTSYYIDGILQLTFRKMRNRKKIVFGPPFSNMYLHGWQTIWVNSEIITAVDVRAQSRWPNQANVSMVKQG